MAKYKTNPNRKVICRNRKALRDYFIEDRIEAGLVLQGTEVKSLREGRANLKDSYAVIQEGEAYLLNLHISEWPGASFFNHIPDRKRKLLLHTDQIRRLAIQLDQRGYTLIALEVYFTPRNKAKVELGLARGKKKIDKRETIRARDELKSIKYDTADRKLSSSVVLFCRNF